MWIITTPHITRVIALKVVLDQTLLTIPLLLAFFPFMSWCEGRENVFAELKEKLLQTYMVERSKVKYLFYQVLYPRLAVCGGSLLRQ